MSRAGRCLISRSPIPKDFDRQSLLKHDGDELETHYRHVLESLDIGFQMKR
jgi:hypothetical protein